MNRTILMVILALALFVAVFALMTQMQRPSALATIFMEISGQRVPVNDLIVYLCSTSFEGSDEIHYNICVTSKDGSIQSQVTFDQNEWKTDSPRINARGQIVYSCNLKLCVLNADGSEKKQFEIPNYMFIPRAINNGGQVVGTCSEWIDGFPTLNREICVINADGSGFRVLESYKAPVYYQGQIAVVGSLNNIGQIISTCSGQAPRGGICLLDFDDHLLWTKQIMPPLFLDAESAVINDNGQIAFICYSRNICRTDIQPDTEFEQIDVGTKVFGHLTINKSGTIAFTCSSGQPGSSGICLLKPNGQAVTRIAESNSLSYRAPTFGKSDVIYFICQNREDKTASICHVQADGTDFQHLELKHPFPENEMWWHIDIP